MPIQRNKYPPFWEKLSQHIRFVRAGNRCEWCGAENYEPHPETGSRVILTVAHIDHDTTNNRFSNLAALCQRCHLSHDRVLHAANQRRKREQRIGQINMFTEEEQYDL